MDDCRKRQTSTATPAEPGDLPWGLALKLSKRVNAHAAQLDEQVRLAVSWFLERENALEVLRETAPQLHEILVGVISRRTCLYGPPPGGTAHRILREEVE